jgi:small-conductance mechanosensitive channel
MKKYIFLIFATFPMVVFGASDLGQIVYSSNGIIRSLVALIVGLALIVFLWGIVKYIWKGEDENARKEAKQFMFWGVVGLTVMVSVWALVSMVANFFGMHIPGGITPSLPNKQY